VSYEPPAEWPTSDPGVPVPGSTAPGYVPPTFAADLAERVIRTFLQAALAVGASDLAGVTSLDAAKGLLIAAVAAGFSAVMGLVGRQFGSPDNASVQG
jgi:hypothetical protein